MVVLEQPGSDHPFRDRVLRGIGESVAAAALPRIGERAVQDRGGGEVERLAVVAQAAGDLAVVDEPWSWSERVAVVSEPREDLAGVPQALFEVLQRVDGSGQRPSQTTRQLLGGAWLSDARKQRLDGTVICGAVPVEVVDRAASGIAGAIEVLAAERPIDALVGRRAARACGWLPGWRAQRAINAVAASSRNVAQGGVA